MFEQLPHAHGLPLPAHETAHSTGFDLLAAVIRPEVIHAGQRKLIPTGLRLKERLPDGVDFQIRSRSGLALNNGVIVLNAPATIDADYEGEIGVILANTGEYVFVVERGMRIAQGVLSTFVQIANKKENIRGSGGFGSTGIDVPPAVKDRPRIMMRKIKHILIAR